MAAAEVEAAATRWFEVAKVFAPGINSLGLGTKRWGTHSRLGTAVSDRDRVQLSIHHGYAACCAGVVVAAGFCQQHYCCLEMSIRSSDGTAVNNSAAVVADPLALGVLACRCHLSLLRRCSLCSCGLLIVRVSSLKPTEGPIPQLRGGFLLLERSP